MAEKKINTVLYDIDQSSDTNDVQKATARANIGAQAELTAGENIEIDPDTNTISSTSAPQVQADWNQNDDSEVDYIKNKPVLATNSIHNIDLIYQQDDYQFSAFMAKRDEYGNLFHLIHNDCVYGETPSNILVGYHNDMTGFTGGTRVIFDVRLRRSITTGDPLLLDNTYTIIDFTVNTTTTFTSFDVLDGSVELTVKNVPSILGKNAHVQLHILGNVVTVHILDQGNIEESYSVEYGDTNPFNSIDKQIPPAICHYSTTDNDYSNNESYLMYDYAVLQEGKDPKHPKEVYPGLVYEGYRNSAFGKKFFVKITCRRDDNLNLVWERHDYPVSMSFVAIYGETSYYEIKRAYDEGFLIAAIDNDQEYTLTKAGTNSSGKGVFIFSGLNSRSWMPDDSGKPCASELICVEDGFDILKPDYKSDEKGFQSAIWTHNWIPLGPIVVVPDSTPYTPPSTYGDGTSLRVINKMTTVLYVDTVVGAVSVFTGKYINLYKYNGSWYWN